MLLVEGVLLAMVSGRSWRNLLMGRGWVVTREFGGGWRNQLLLRNRRILASSCPEHGLERPRSSPAVSLAASYRPLS